MSTTINEFFFGIFSQLIEGQCVPFGRIVIRGRLEKAAGQRALRVDDRLHEVLGPAQLDAAQCVGHAGGGRRHNLPRIVHCGAAADGQMGRQRHRVTKWIEKMKR